MSGAGQCAFRWVLKTLTLWQLPADNYKTRLPLRPPENSTDVFSLSLSWNHRPSLQPTDSRQPGNHSNLTTNQSLWDLPSAFGSPEWMTTTKWIPLPCLSMSFRIKSLQKLLVPVFLSVFDPKEQQNLTHSGSHLGKQRRTTKKGLAQSIKSRTHFVTKVSFTCTLPPISLIIKVVLWKVKPTVLTTD